MDGHDRLDEYNPFSEPVPKFDRAPSNRSHKSPTRTSPEQPPVDLNNSKGPDGPPTYNQILANYNLELDLKRRQEALEAKAAALDRFEQEQKIRMAAMNSIPLPHNWPPLPSFCPCKPCVRQDFESDIPFECRMLAKMGYFIWLSYAFLLLLNMSGTLGYFIVSTSPSASTVFGVSILLLLCMPPITFFLWHRQLYKALRSDSSRNYVIFFPAFGTQIVIILIQCLGIDYLGSCGWINGSKTFASSTPVGILMVTVAGLFTVLACACVYLIIKVHRYYRSAGRGIPKTRLEMNNASAYEISNVFGAMP